MLVMEDPVWWGGASCEQDVVVKLTAPIVHAFWRRAVADMAGEGDDLECVLTWRGDVESVVVRRFWIVGSCLILGFWW